MGWLRVSGCVPEEKWCMTVSLFIIKLYAKTVITELDKCYLKCGQYELIVETVGL